MMLTISQALVVISRLESGKSQRKVIALYNTGLLNCLWHKETEGPIMIVYGIKWKSEGPFQVTDIERVISTIWQCVV
jgi:hypothetical protein